MALSRIAAYRICKDFEKWRETNRKALVPKDAMRMPSSTLSDADLSRLNDSERAFVERAREKESKVYRAGWPDFLVEMSDKTIAVEVKQGSDEVRENQRKMFAALERIGIPVLVWNPASRETLTPWRNYKPEKFSGRKAVKTDAYDTNEG